jgi:hypothetical protein
MMKWHVPFTSKHLADGQQRSMVKSTSQRYKVAFKLNPTNYPGIISLGSRNPIIVGLFSSRRLSDSRRRVM